MNRSTADRTHALLKGQIEVWTRRCLWTPADAINFKPALCDKVYGDGGALFGLTTIHLRPAYYVIRGDSQWSCGLDSTPDLEIDCKDFGEFTDEILTALEEEFGDACCGYSGTSRYAAPLREYVAKLPATLRAEGDLNPWCGLCGSGSDTWICELRRTRYRTIEEAQPELERLEAEQMLTRALWGDLHLHQRPN